jgi:hypothetical protein
MRSASSLVRTLATTSSVLLLWLLSVSPASAAPALQRGTAGPVCDPHTTTLRRLARHTKTFGGPLKQAPRLQFGLSDPTSRLLRGTRAPFAGDEAAIQNDAPAARIEENGRPDPSLLPLGLLTHAAGGRPRSSAASPRSPRGPPIRL